MRSVRRFIAVIALSAILILALTSLLHHSNEDGPEHRSSLSDGLLLEALPFFWQETNDGCPNFTLVTEDHFEREAKHTKTNSQQLDSSSPHLLEYMKSTRRLVSFNFSDCQMSKCFDMSRCQTSGPLRVHILPGSTETTDLNDTSLGESNIIHKHILAVIRNSKHFEPDPEKACLFVLEDDTLDRDPLSKSFRPDIESILNESNLYGMNYLVFNLYSGSWPDYKEDDFSSLQFGAAIIAKASNSITYHRKNFDISLPLFSYLLPYSDEAEQPSFSESSCDSNCTYFLTFKGKRYVYGRGSNTRNSVYHIHNNRDVIMLTTCRHGKKWRNLSDKRCDNDELNYEKYDFIELMKQSTFCLVPRGRRLGSFRFIEALSYGCIPVVLSDGWIKPFDELIDWSCSMIQLPESLLLHTPDLLRDLDQHTISRMKASCRAIYKQYFSSVEKIILSTISIIAKRIELMKYRNQTITVDHD